MKTAPSRRLNLARAAAFAGLFGSVAIELPAGAADVVILKDGFVIQGTVRKEQTTISDKATGKQFLVAKDTGFDIVDEGPKFTIFSGHSRQGGAVLSNLQLRPDYRAYKTTPTGVTGADPLPSGGTIVNKPDFNAKWMRTLTIRNPDGTKDLVNQQITYLDPYYCYIWSNSHSWRLGYRTSEMDPAMIRKLLSTHPDLVEIPGKPDAGKRIAMARFMLDAGWLQLARDDLDKIKKDVPSGVPNAAKETYDKLVKDVDTATAALVVKEGELALNAGRYEYAGRLLAAFPQKLATAKQTDDITKLMARWKSSKEKHETCRRFLRETIDAITGNNRFDPLLAAAGAPVFASCPVKKLATPMQKLADAAEEVYREMHPDAASRLDVFYNLALVAQKERMQGRDPTKRPDELLAAAVSGWAMGGVGATPEVNRALKFWAARDTVLRFQRTDDLNTRNVILGAYKQTEQIPLDSLAVIISRLPPAEPENLLFRSGERVPAEHGVPPGVHKRMSRPTKQNPAGVPYFVKLPPEYHHGRAYPVLIVLTPPTFDPGQVLGSLAYEADKHGYILLSPDWGGLFGKPWQWDGKDHEFVTETLRDAVRHFCIDNDRVFLFGAGDGGSGAMDIGMSHPDLFAGVLAMGAQPIWQNMFINYWQNAQTVPFYVVTGELAGDAPQTLRKIYHNWTRWGFPSLMVVYKGRGMEWYGGEVPVMFDWMGRKKRVSAKATLKLDTKKQFEWETMRTTDNHFYWIGVEEIDSRRDIENHRGGLISPATIMADFRGNNVINVKTLGVMRFSLWLSNDMIGDWSKPVPITVNVNGGAVADLRGKKISPDLNVLLEDYRQRGDRRMLFLQRLQITRGQGWKGEVSAAGP
ncbi:MAG TPA: hypothetical protein VLM40_07420 [Gemmata sp.]|nr:hypothetical protein [Gemmata sp.]